MLNILGVNIHIYGLLIGLGVFAGLQVAHLVRPRLSKEIDEGFVWALIFGVVGARAYHVIDYWQRYYVTNPEKILAVWEGGLGIWGAIAGAVLGLWIYCHFKQKNIWGLLDAFAVGAPLAQTIGRLGNRVNGELEGKNGEPLFLYEGVLNIVLFALLWKKANGKTMSGKIFSLYLAGYGVIRIVLEGFRPDNEIWKIYGIPTAVFAGLVSMVAGYLINRRRS